MPKACTNWPFLVFHYGGEFIFFSGVATDFAPAPASQKYPLVNSMEFTKK